ncbi:MAG TPA: hypothetical protein VMT52_11655 [Planctomycetota bacterium]|nr:hypothetical protein [Planctomycetota bacterium]
MDENRSLGSFWEFVRRGQYRHFQERDLFLDLYQNGWPGVLLGLTTVACGVVFLLAIFHVITERRHVVRILLGLGLIAAATGFAASYVHFRGIEAWAPRVQPRPDTQEQLAAILALPLIAGAATLAGALLGCIYMAAFWGTSALKPRKSTA